MPVNCTIPWKVKCVYTNWSLAKILFDTINVYQEDVTVHANGIVVRCPGLFQGEAILMLEDGSRSMLFVMMALKPESEIFFVIFNQLCEKSFPQCIYLP